MEPTDVEQPSAERIRERHDRLLASLRDAAEANGHDPDRLRIIGVTKTHPVEVARAALEAGIARLGESRVQEAEPKIASLPEAEWHFIGRLQSNKARRAVRGFSFIHSIDSLDLLDRVLGHAADEEAHPRLLLQVNVSGERSKAGLRPEDLLAARLPAEVIGLMTMAPMGAPAAEARAVFGRLRDLRNRVEQASGIGLPELSMGMSADAEAAAAEGATLVRIGTALFGPRDETLYSLRR
ncbi:MAG TPA: YggS family pyridoxal phosphate-dependent enzyme [Candidatus Limnocylindria bacterium]